MQTQTKNYFTLFHVFYTIDYVKTIGWFDFVTESASYEEWRVSATFSILICSILTLHLKSELWISSLILLHASKELFYFFQEFSTTDDYD